MTSHTIVFQSYRTVAVPGWIEHCLGSVRRWTADRGHDYAFLDDAFLGLVPDWYATKADGHVYLVTDLARLLAARDFLARGYRRAIWVDADVLVFHPARFTLDVRRDHAFCSEVWIMRDAAGVQRAHCRVNNSISCYDRGNPFLDFYIHACQQIVRHHPSPVPPLSVGTKFLTGLQPQLRFALVPNAGLLAPPVQAELLAGSEEAPRLLMEHHTGPLYAANLCAHFQGRATSGVRLSEADFAAVVELLLRSQGEVLNRCRPRDARRAFQVSPSFTPDSASSRYLWGDGSS